MSQPRVKRLEERGPFDVVGDVHGCALELAELLGALGYETKGWPVGPPAGGLPIARHPGGRRLVFVGDVVDRGPDTPAVLRLVMSGVAAGDAFCVVGNHDDKLYRALIGRRVQIKHGLSQSLAQLEREPAAFREQVRDFLGDLPSHLILDGGRLVVTHAGLPERLHGTESERVRDFAMYGATTGRLDRDGLPQRLNWAAEYRGEAYVVYGHTPVVEPVWLNRTIDIDTGCAFGHRLSALRYPEMEIVSVPARRTYIVKGSPFRHVGPGGELAPEPDLAPANEPLVAGVSPLAKRP
jgi:protein phosphatase